jgi:Spy/CpxP family protein refolding chaperone
MRLVPANTKHALHGVIAMVMLSAAVAVAQAPRPSGPPVPPPPTSVGPGPGGPGQPLNPNAPPRAFSANNGSKADAQSPGALQIGPGGRWWDGKRSAHIVGLKPEQRQHMDAVFDANKVALYNTYRNLKQQESTLDALQRAESPDESKILAQIDRVTALRGELAKQSASLALELRKQLTPDQQKQLTSAK